MLTRILITVFALLLAIAAFTQTPHCKGTTAKGVPCRSTFIDSTGYCRYHNPNRILCTHAGCHNVVKTKGSYCRFHNN